MSTWYGLRLAPPESVAFDVITLVAAVAAVAAVGAVPASEGSDRAWSDVLAHTRRKRRRRW